MKTSHPCHGRNGEVTQSQMREGKTTSAQSLPTWKARHLTGGP